MKYQVNLSRTISKRIRPEKIQAQVDFLIQRAMNGNRGRCWAFECESVNGPESTPAGWKYSCDVSFEKTSGKGIGGEIEFKQWQDIKAMLTQTGKNSKFQDSPWIITDNNESFSESDVEENNSSVDGVSTVAACVSDKVLDWQDLKFPEELLEGDEALAGHPAFCDLYDLGPQIRTVLSAIKRAVDTNGASRYHSVLYGEPGCGKTSTLRAVEKLFGPGSVLHLDATTTTKAGIEKLFFNELKQYPRLVFLEEAEKAPEDGLKIWLGALDDRGELRKVNFRQTQVREIQILFFCTANNKRAFDNMMGTGSGEPGALSSRCVNEIQFPRPAESTLRKILEKEIDLKGGNKKWVTPCLDLARELKVADPRKVKAFLTGGDRLLDGSFQEDQRSIRKVNV